MSQTEILKPGAQMLWNEALQLPKRFGHQQPGLNHLLLALLERHGPMAESLASGLNAASYHDILKARLEAGDTGAPIDPAALLEEASAEARAEGQDKVSERHLARLFLSHDGWTIHTDNLEPNRDQVRDPTAENTLSPRLKEPLPEAAGTYCPKARHSTPLLDQLGTDLCRQAAEGKLSPILGRDLEIEETISTLCRWTKRNPLLIGPAGVGKTAIIEGLAQRVVSGSVPAPMQGNRIISLQASSLVSGITIYADFLKRMEALLKEASQDGIILLIDELHSIIGAGGERRSSDVASLMKPALAKGEIACIGATTEAEYHQFIEPDRALERRFKPLRVQELSREATLDILRSSAERSARERGVSFAAGSLELIVQLAGEYLRTRYFPDKAIDVLEQCFAFAMLNGIKEVSPTMVHDVLQRMVGMPIDLGSELTNRLIQLREDLVCGAFCPQEAADEVAARLGVTMRGLDMTPARPNAVLLVAAGPGQAPELAAQMLARSLFGGDSRLIEIDMTRFIHSADVTYFTGAPPGYVGHDKTPPFQLELAQRPWSVVLFKDVDASHPQAQVVLAQALHCGYFTNGAGEKVYLSSAVAVLTVTAQEKTQRRLGFGAETGQGTTEPAAPATEDADQILPELAAEVDVAWRPRRPDLAGARLWIERWLLPPVAERYHSHGLSIQWDQSLTSWLAQAVTDHGDHSAAMHLLEEQVLPLLIPCMQGPGCVTVARAADGLIRITSTTGG